MDDEDVPSRVQAFPGRNDGWFHYTSDVVDVTSREAVALWLSILALCEGTVM